MAKKTHRVSWINGNARSESSSNYEREGQNCTEDDAPDVREKMQEALAEKIADKPEKYDSDWIEVRRRDDLD